ncbi:MAG: thioredoxin-disulfide reductase [Chitinophagales bacterium]|jgi:thioredoxin reductase (NADPH)|nr:thioredoxin-disulfide reductase [Chitinophagales bacterium]
MTNHTECFIIGSGPAGYTAAIYASRANLKPILYQGHEPGGQLMTTNDVENFPGYPEAITGPKLMEDLQRQAARFGADIRNGWVSQVDFSTKPFKIIVNNKDNFTADTVIIATGAQAKWLGIPSEQRLNGLGVSACAVCDGFFYKGQDVAIVGAGDTACEEALYLSKICNQVHMFIRRDEMRASKIMQDRVKSTPNIHIYWNTTTDEILGEKGVEAVRVKNSLDNTTQEIPITGFFVAIGHTPQSAIFKPYLDLDEEGYIITQPGKTATNVSGVFACGDVMDKNYRQAITAAGTGCMAALEAERYLAHHK